MSLFSVGWANIQLGVEREKGQGILYRVKYEKSWAVSIAQLCHRDLDATNIFSHL